jgi:hypothetical protein
MFIVGCGSVVSLPSRIANMIHEKNTQNTKNSQYRWTKSYNMYTCPVDFNPPGFEIYYFILIGANYVEEMILFLNLAETFFMSKSLFLNMYVFCFHVLSIYTSKSKDRLFTYKWKFDQIYNSPFTYTINKSLRQSTTKYT